ncbi:UNVERIFIED_CONTAM: hypothetical protein Slati_3925400 [Sesamum latifolium]|uniref:Uncharacterized protein n=1 Tax=Sesamum latifolium TaxID=2727402 RepID=A0AAW2TMN6_9LAMI
MYADFAEEPCNVRLGLCTDGFAPHGQYSHTYSCWHYHTPYNLPPGMCMSFEYIFLTMVIPGLSNSKRLINVYFEPLIEELLQLWHVEYRRVWDVRFVWMTQVHFICSTVGKRATLTATDSFSLSTIPTEGTRKPSRRILSNKVAHPKLSVDQLLDWVADISPAVEISLSLPSGYGSNHKWMKKKYLLGSFLLVTLLIRHNLDVMHIEKNVFDKIKTRSWTSRKDEG